MGLDGAGGCLPALLLFRGVFLLSFNCPATGEASGVGVVAGVAAAGTSKDQGHGGKRGERRRDQPRPTPARGVLPLAPLLSRPFAGGRKLCRLGGEGAGRTSGRRGVGARGVGEGRRRVGNGASRLLAPGLAGESSAGPRGAGFVGLAQGRSTGTRAQQQQSWRRWWRWETWGHVSLGLAGESSAGPREARIYDPARIRAPKRRVTGSCHGGAARWPPS